MKTATNQPVSAATKTELPPASTPVEQVLALLQSGKLSMAEFQAWDKSRNLQQEGPGRARKTVCPITGAEFQAKAGMLNVDLGDTVLKGKPKLFSTGSFGWNITGKFNVIIDGHELTVQMSANAIVCGSKPGSPAE